ncbi:MAG: hypothetical protein ACRDRX_22330 [Pseudonocardiaceae bacterium]
MRLDENLSGIKLPDPDDFSRKNLTFLVLFDDEQTKDVYDLPLAYSLETGVVRWEDSRGIHTISLRDNEELAGLWEPMTAERFTYLMATLHPTFTRGIHRYRRCVLDVSPEGQILKSASGEDLEFTSLAYFPRPVDKDKEDGWRYWDVLLAPSEIEIRANIVPVTDRKWMEKIASQPTLADFGWEAAKMHAAIQEPHPIPAEIINEIYRLETTKGIVPPDPELIPQTAAYLHEKLGVDPHPNDWTPAQWASANNARLASRLHAQTADFPPDKAAHAILTLTAAVKNQRSQRPPFMTAATINPQGLLIRQQGQQRRI